jgi:hypothetical protein
MRVGKPALSFFEYLLRRFTFFGDVILALDRIVRLSKAARTYKNGLRSRGRFRSGRAYVSGLPRQDFIFT